MTCNENKDLDSPDVGPVTNLADLGCDKQYRSLFENLFVTWISLICYMDLSKPIWLILDATRSMGAPLLFAAFDIDGNIISDGNIIIGGNIKGRTL